MTSETATSHPTPTTLRVAKTRTVLVPLVIAGVCWTAGQAALPDMGLEWGQRYDAVAAARGLQAASTALLFAAGVALVTGAIALARLVGPGRRLVTVGTTLLGIGGVWLCAGRAAFNLQFLDVTGTDLPREQALALLSSTSPVFAVFPLTLLALLVGPVLLGIAVRRSTWAPLVLWVVGIGLFVGTEFQVKAGEVVGIGLASAALGLLGREVVRDAVTGTS